MGTGELIALGAVILSLLALVRAYGRDSKKDSEKRIEEIKVKAKEFETEMREQHRKQCEEDEKRIIRAHERMNEIEGNYNAKFLDVNTKADTRHDAQMKLIEEIRATQVQSSQDTKEVRINLKTMMQHNNIPYQE